MIINKRKINEQNKPYIIAELSANHGGNLNRAKKSIEMAAKAGVSAVKLQTYTPDTMTINSSLPDFKINDGLWADRTLYDLYSEAYTPFEWHEELFKHAYENNITIFSTPFDESAVDLLESLNTPAYKIASFEIVDIPLIKYIAKKNKPIFMSTGMASEDEIKNAVQTIRETSKAELLLFHCISSYPAPIEQSNLNMIQVLKEKFKVEVGLSDHTLDNFAATLSISMGAVAIEKHFILDKSFTGPDSEFSMDPSQLEDLVKDTKTAWKALGSGRFERAAVEKSSIQFRRSIYFINDLKKGDFIKENDIKRIRPGYGIKPKFFNEIIGKKILKDVQRGDPVKWEVLEN